MNKVFSNRKLKINLHNHRNSFLHNSHCNSLSIKCTQLETIAKEAGSYELISLRIRDGP